ncbi:23S rRNA (guanosine(2251)-2'-O)-methyltransferase RlmB [Ureaplasma urealyticum]|uniref:23S rRNA (Guanosine(2251)-2'-O)-methyltransferase RlmB n=1 Tax=Ureaplasma urealyticum TaxID=2130 RepID=A0AAX1QZI4_UREUR|nr:23S rRNA (guanosine(2251)-2'-O)-methyltransferase RlmB [Ureaplasma urealyticum]EDX53817.1 RNA methyltransferase, TrmH family, group 3 [Ureaplasma urealyticum serovar 9 str. ATCC 33175]EDX53123.1 RNA methyltransferase, TrmH family, group 3 [Ureaplasma urealyticum serovar 12 str. ATCC 33696]EDY74759.1 RNA methyltransferase, TrmH family, group 3 [Ureaplasma urealyticum serovar 4 str. ATCC 27816]MCF1348815.1 23S rRNA (guanosine(2251)-2'-O)-methyltransferase RlmB [Ureaplasma urealyticum]QDI63513
MNYNFGKKALLDAINNKQIISKVYLLEKNYELINLINKNQISYEVVNERWFKQFDHSLNHQNIAFKLVKKSFQKTSLESFLKLIKKQENALILMLDEIEDPRNFGAIIRTANAFGVDGIIYKKYHQASINDLVIKTSMGAINYIHMIEVSNLSNAIKNLQNEGFWVYATSLLKSQSYEKVDYANKSVFIVGNESKGVSPLILKNADQSVRIDMFGDVQSLNVGVATGIILAHYRTKIKP